MIPIVKAADLFLSFYQELPDYMYEKQQAVDLAKKFAIIVVDEIINEYKGYIQSAPTFEFGLEYWQEVKIEIEKL